MDGKSATSASAKRLRFDRYVLDLDRGCLLLENDEIVLRPKTFAVLRHLVENSGRLVSKDELFAAVWPNITVTDDVLVQSIGELRRALRDDGSRLLRTVPRRGYRLETDVTAEELSVPPSRDPPSRSSGWRHPVPGAGHSTLSAASRMYRGLPYALGALAILILAGAGLWGSIGPKYSGRPSIAADRVDNNGAEFSSKPAIAVLPFLNRSDDSGRDYFADGLTQDIINVLGRFPELTVMSWNAVRAYKGKSESPGQIARNLAVDYQVEGSVVHNGERIGVLVQFVSVDGRVLWSVRFEEALSDFFVLQSRIASEIAGSLAIRLSQVEQQRVLAKPTNSLEAYDYVLRARAAMQRSTRAASVDARLLLRRAIEIDPDYAAAYAALSETYYNAVSMGWAESPTGALQQAERMANKALALNAFDVRAYIVLGRVRIFFQQFEQARVELGRAIAINPNDANALAGHGNILMWMGQTDAAIEALERAQRIDPDLNPLDSFALGLAYYVKGRYDAAVAQAEINLRRSENAHFNHAVLAAAFAQQSRSDEADRIVVALRHKDPTFDPGAFGSKFLNPANLEHLREGLRKAGLFVDSGAPSSANPPG